MTTTTAFISLFVFCQTFGAFIGALSAVWGELAYMRAMRDGKIDSAERAHLHSIANGLRFGMILILLSSFGLTITAYVTRMTLQPALSTNYWILITLSILIIGMSWALSRHQVSFALGSAIVFTAWWFLAYLTLGWIPLISFGAAVAFFVVATTVFYAVLQYGRFLATRQHD